MKSAGCAELARLFATPTKQCTPAAAPARKNPTIVMRICALVLIFAFAVSGQEIEDGDTWARPQIGHDVSITLQYGDLKVTVYEQLKKPKASQTLTAEDANRLLSESTAKVKVETFDDPEVPNPSSEAQIYEMLDKDSQETIKENENYRPDQVTQTISDIYRRSDEEAQKMLSFVFSNSKSNNIDAAVELIKHRLVSRADGDAKSSSETDRSVDTSSKSQSDSSASSKQSQSQNRDEQRVGTKTSFGSRDVKVTYSKTTLTAGVNVASKTSLETIYWLAEMQLKQTESFDKMYSKMKAMNEQLNQLAGTLKNVESRLHETAGDLKTKDTEIVIQIGQEREKIKVLADTLEDVANQSNATRNQLAEAQRSYDRNLQIDREAVAVVGNKLKTLESSTINQSIATQNQLAEIQTSCQRNLEAAITGVSNKLKSLEGTTVSQWNATQSQPVEVERTIKKLKICPPSIGPRMKCYNNETFGCYCLVGVDLSVTEAARFCQSQAMRLVSIESPAEEQYLTQIIEAANFGKYIWTYWWTSGSDVEVENKWVWTATGQPVQYTNWAPGEPNNLNGKEHYIGIRVEGRTVKWFDFPAKSWDGYNSINTICEY